MFFFYKINRHIEQMTTPPKSFPIKVSPTDHFIRFSSAGHLFRRAISTSQPPYGSQFVIKVNGTKSNLHPLLPPPLSNQPPHPISISIHDAMNWILWDFPETRHETMSTFFRTTWWTSIDLIRHMIWDAMRGRRGNFLPLSLILCCYFAHVLWL